MNNLKSLHIYILDNYDGDELKTLCMNMKIHYDDLPGGTRAGKARELILYCQRRNILEQLKHEIGFEE